MVERLEEMRKGRRERIDKGSREKIEKKERDKKLKEGGPERPLPFLEFSRSGPAMKPLFHQVLRV